MTVTRADIADLREGDVVALRHTTWPPGQQITGPLSPTPRGQGLILCGYNLSRMDPSTLEMQVVSRAPRPLYTNSGRAKPVVGDVCRDADEGRDTRFWMYCSGDIWYESTGARYAHRKDLPPKSLLLILDGQTGEPPA